MGVALAEKSASLEKKITKFGPAVTKTDEKNRAGAMKLLNLEQDQKKAIEAVRWPPLQPIPAGSLKFWNDFLVQISKLSRFRD